MRCLVFAAQSPLCGEDTRCTGLVQPSLREALCCTDTRTSRIWMRVCTSVHPCVQARLVARVQLLHLCLTEATVPPLCPFWPHGVQPARWCPGLVKHAQTNLRHHQLSLGCSGSVLHRCRAPMAGWRQPWPCTHGCTMKRQASAASSWTLRVLRAASVHSSPWLLPRPRAFTCLCATETPDGAIPLGCLRWNSLCRNTSAGEHLAPMAQ